MLNTPMELSNDQDESILDDLEETTEEVEESNSVDDEELESSDDDSEGDENEDETFLIGDEEITLSDYEELKKNQMLHSDYTKKRQAESAEFKARMSDIDTLLEEADMLESFIDEDEKLVDWDSLMKSEEREIEAKFKARRKQISDIRASGGKAKGKISQEVLTETNQAVNSHFSEWQGKEGSKTQKADLDKALAYAKSIGHTDESIGRLTKPEDFIALIEAAKYHAIKNAKPESKKQRKTPKTVAQRKSAKSKTKSTVELFYGTQEY